MLRHQQSIGLTLLEVRDPPNRELSHLDQDGFQTRHTFRQSLESQIQESCSTTKTMTSTTGSQDNSYTSAEANHEEQSSHLSEVHCHLRDTDGSTEFVMQKARESQVARVPHLVSFEPEGFVRVDSSATALTHKLRTIRAIEGLHWHLGEVRCLARFEDSKLSRHDFEKLTNDKLPVHTYAYTVRPCKCYVNVVWRPQWIAIEEADVAMLTSLFRRVEHRLGQIPLPERDFWWRVENREVVLDYSSAYHLCSVDHCTLCREPSVVEQGF